VGDSVIVSRRILSDNTVGLTVLNAPPPWIPVSMYATSVEDVAVEVVAVAIVTGAAGSSEAASAPLCAENTIEDVEGMFARQRSSRHLGQNPSSQVDT
jgi:hypothetical protein